MKKKKLKLRDMQVSAYHEVLTKLGIPRRENGQKLGLRKRMANVEQN